MFQEERGQYEGHEPTNRHHGESLWQAVGPADPYAKALRKQCCFERALRLRPSEGCGNLNSFYRNGQSDFLHRAAGGTVTVQRIGMPCSLVASVEDSSASEMVGPRIQKMVLDLEPAARFQSGKGSAGPPMMRTPLASHKP